MTAQLYGLERVQVERRPLTMLGIAFGCGILLSILVGGPRRRSRSTPPATAPDGPHEAPPPPGALDETWDRVKGAVLGVVASRAAEFLDDVIPGSAEPEAHRAPRRAARSDSSGNRRRSTEV